MMREYQHGDLHGFEPNEFSDLAPDAVYEVMGEHWDRYTLVYQGKVVCVACVTHLGDWVWKGLFLVSKHFTARNGLELKRFMQKGLGHFQPKKLWTISRRNEIIEQWHHFMGLRRGEPTVVNGIQCDVWEI